jgi:hypothetical protein
MGLDLADGFNQGGIVLPYYLDRLQAPVTRLASHAITEQDARSLAGSGADVWAALKNRAIPIQFADPDMQRLGQYAGALTLVHRTAQAPDALSQLIAVYEQVLPLTVAPAPQCLLRQELALLRLVADDIDGAEQDILAAIAQCPSGAPDGSDRAGLLYRIETARLARIPAGDTAGRRAIARRLLSLNPKDTQALSILTIDDLASLFRDGRAAVDDAGAPGPVEMRRFTMPQDGDWGDALFAHPPARISFRVELPAEPAELRFRIALAPESWEWGGDGATFIVAASAGAQPPRELFRRRVSNAPEDRRWHPASVSLAPYAGQAITLTLETQVGPAGDATGDWAGWDDPRVVHGE